MALRARNTLITGLAARLPGAASAEAFWTLLDEGRCAITKVGAERFDTRLFHHPKPGTAGRSYTFAAGQIEDVFGFDAAFFGISPREAAQIDPQQRLLMQVAWEAIESAGLKARDLAGSQTGVYVGASALDYHQRMLFDLPATDTHAMTGNTLSIISNRLSYIFDLRGPSFTVDTACSSSLVALHEAVRALESGEIDTAIVAGVNLLLSPFSFIGFSRASMLSRQGLCRAFDASGDGYVRSEGAVALVLQREDLVAPDRARARIVATGTNSDGRTAGLSLPSSDAQAQLLASIYRDQDLSPESLAFIEAHGTGTQVGDPAEAMALGSVIGAARSRALPIGSAKTNVGHLEPVSGLVGLLKAVLALSHDRLPRSLHFEQPNPNIDFERLNLSVASEPLDLPRTSGLPRLAGINSFGFGGTNAHTVIADIEPVLGNGQSERPQTGVPDTAPLVISARSRAALRELAARYADKLKQAEAPAGAISDAAIRLRDMHDHRLVVLGDTLGKTSALEAYARGETSAAAIEGTAPTRGRRLAYAFSGNGSQWAGMGQDAYRQDTSFREAFEDLDRHFMSVAGWSLVTMLYSRDLDTEIGRTEVAQPLLFAVQVSLVTALRARGINADAVLGHSVGEVAAAWCCGLLDLPTATRIIHARSTQQEVVRDLGGMAALLLPAEAAVQALAKADLPGLELSAINSPRSVTISGPIESIEAFMRFARAERWAVRKLDIAYPFHSSLVDPIETPLRSALGEIATAPARLPFHSSVHPDRETIVPDATYWWENVRHPVRFAEAIESVLGNDIDVIIEIGPRPVLTTYLRDTLGAHGHNATVLSSFEQPGRRSTETTSIDVIAARLVAHGVRVDLDRYVGPAGRFLPDLPHYPWQLAPCLFEPTTERIERIGGLARVSPLAGIRLRPEAPVWFNVIDTELLPFLADHKVEETVVFPAAGYLEMALAAARDWTGVHGIELRNLDIFRPLVLDDGRSVETLVRLSPDDHVIELLFRPRLSDGDWSLHARCDYRTLAAGAKTPDDAFHETFRETVDSAALYELTRAHGLDYGPAFRRVDETHILSESRAESCLTTEPSSDDIPFSLDPMLADAGFHGLFVLVSRAAPQQHGLSFLPVRFDRIQLFAPATPPTRARISIRKASTRSILADFEFFDAQDNPVASLSAVRFKAVQLHALPTAEDGLIYHVDTCLLPPAGNGVDTWSNILPDLEDLIKSAGLVTPDSSPDEPSDEVLLLDALARRVALDGLSRLSHPKLRVDELAERLRPLAEQALDELERHDLASRDGSSEWRLVLPEDAASTEELVEALSAVSGRHAIETALLLRAAELLPSALQPNDPGATKLSLSGTMTDAWRSDGATARFLDEAARRMVLVVAGHLPSDRCTRLLLVGARHHALAEYLSRSLPVGTTRLAITDHSEVQLARLERSWTGHPATRFLTPDALGEEAAGSFDLVITLGARARPPRHMARMLANLVASGGWVLTLEEASTLRHGLIDALCDDGPAGDHVTGPLGLSAAVEGLVLGTDNTIRLQLSRRQASATAAGETGSDADSSPRPSVLLLQLLAAGPSIETSELRAALSERGVSATLAVAGTQTRRMEGDLWEVALDADGTNVPETLHQAATDGIVLLGGSDPETGACEALGALGWRLMQTLRAGLGASSPIILVAPGGAVVARDRIAPAPVQSGLWALARVAMNEFPERPLYLIDPGLAVDDSSLAAIAGEVSHILQARPKEREVVLRAGQRLGLRIERGPEPGTVADVAPAGNRAIRLETTAQGTLDRLAWTPLERRPLGHDEVEIAVEASGLNFRDVMWALGLLPEEALEDGFAGATLGMECCGRVARVGDHVQRLAVGDRVIAFAPAAFASHVTVSERGCARAPEGLAPEAAATIPVAFLTSYYALVELGRISEGDTVLIHGGAGGVGLAALQIARNAGAIVIATAGSPEKRALLRALGAHHVLDSRSLDFSDQVMALTGNHGVDIVLNSLFGEAMERSVDLLKPFGRFLELGKRDYYENRRLGLRPFRRNLSYFGIDADQLLIHQPKLAERLLTHLMELFEGEALLPLPYRVFPADRAVDAFRLMQQAGHIGKIVLLPPELPAPRAAVRPLTLSGQSVEIVAGGFGGFGAELVRRLADLGARRIAVLARRGDGSDEARALIAELGDRGVSVSGHACDLSDPESVARTLEKIRRENGPITGVYHTAMVLHDTLIANMSREALDQVLAPKVTGAALLDKLTRQDPIERFVLFSSATTLVGNPGQANYVAANGFLEGLAARRRAEGLPALAVAWGAISDAGFLARNGDVGDLLARKLGRHALTAREALDGLVTLLSGADGNPETAAVTGYARIDWSAARRDLSLLATPYAERLGLSAETSDHGEGQINIALLLEGLDPPAATAKVADLLKTEIGRILRIPDSEIDPSRPLVEIGMDSLMALELRMAAERQFGIDIPLMSLANGASLTDMAGRIVASVNGSAATNTSLSAEARASVLQHAGAADLAESEDLSDLAEHVERRMRDVKSIL